jgi:hypothetical protein
VRNTSGLRHGGPGRKRGVPNKATTAVRELTRSLLDSPEYRHRLQHRLNTGKIAPAMEVLLWHYAFGKPKELVSAENGQEPVRFTLQIPHPSGQIQPSIAETSRPSVSREVTQDRSDQARDIPLKREAARGRQRET